MHIQEKYILNFVTLLKAKMGLTWQIMPREVQKRKKNKEKKKTKLY